MGSIVRKRTLFNIITMVMLIIVVQSLPILFLRNVGMEVLEGDYVRAYYDKGDIDGGKKVFSKLEKTAEELYRKLDFNRTELTNVYIYMRQSSLHIRKAGYLTLLVPLDWYIGDNKKDIVLIVSPNSENRMHNENSILEAAIHEFVHTVNYQINPQLPYFLDNGVATYLSGQKPYNDFAQYLEIPDIDYLEIENQKKFGETDGYFLSYTFIEFLDLKYGWEAVIDLINGELTYDEIFSKGKEQIYYEWKEYVENNYK